MRLGQRCNEGKLSILDPLGPRAHLVLMEERRTLYVTQDLRRYFELRQSLKIRADLNDFILGRDVNVALGLDQIDCRMARLDPADAEVWEIRIYERNPQWRLFGRFATTDVFVVLRGPILRKEVTGRFDQMINECHLEWRSLFGSSNPPNFIGSNRLHDYISRNGHIVSNH